SPVAPPSSHTPALHDALPISRSPTSPGGRRAVAAAAVRSRRNPVSTAPRRGPERSAARRAATGCAAPVGRTTERAPACRARPAPRRRSPPADRRPPWPRPARARRQRRAGRSSAAAEAWVQPTTGPRPSPAPALAWVGTGGLVAAVPGPLGLEHGSWSAAFQVLVGGVMQGVLGIAQAHLAARRIGRRPLLAQLLTWNLGCLAVIGGTLL